MQPGNKNMDQPDLNPFRSFFDNWTTYDKIIYYNYMVHNEIHAALRNFLLTNIPGDFSLLDLGCGDISRMVQSLEGISVIKYIGVDSSGEALQKASLSLEKLICEKELVENDLLNFTENCEPEQFDVVIAGYSLHHIYYNNKQKFFDNCFRVLKPGGYFVHYDVVRLHEESREQYMQRYFTIIDEWTNLDISEIESIKEHVSRSDFPSSYEELAFMAVNSGFTTKPGRIYSDKNRVHSLSCFLKK